MYEREKEQPFGRVFHQDHVNFAFAFGTSSQYLSEAKHDWKQVSRSSGEVGSGYFSTGLRYLSTLDDIPWIKHAAELTIDLTKKEWLRTGFFPRHADAYALLYDVVPHEEDISSASIPCLMQVVSEDKFGKYDIKKNIDGKKREYTKYVRMVKHGSLLSLTPEWLVEARDESPRMLLHLALTTSLVQDYFYRMMHPHAGNDDDVHNRMEDVGYRLLSKIKREFPTYRFSEQDEAIFKKYNSIGGNHNAWYYHLPPVA